MNVVDTKESKYIPCGTGCVVIKTSDLTDKVSKFEDGYEMREIADDYSETLNYYYSVNHHWVLN